MGVLGEFDITGQKTLIIGGSRGIGRGIARAFADAGSDVAVTGLTDVNAKKTAEELASKGVNTLALGGDATKGDDMDKIVDKVLSEWGNVDTLINCVGDAIRKPVSKLPGTQLEGMSEEEWHFILDINLTEAFQGCRALGPHFLEKKSGNVINISGWASFRGRAQSAAYDAAKAGVMRFTECLAQEWAPFNIRVNAVAPGRFPDPEQLTEEVYKGRQQEAAGEIPLGRLGKLKEPGYLCVFLASEAASYVTGQTWAIDGGISIKHP